MTRSLLTNVAALIAIIAMAMSGGYALSRCENRPVIVPIDAAIAPAAPSCVYDRSLLSKIADSLVEAGYQGRIEELVTNYGKPQIDCQLELILTSVTAGMSNGAAALSPIEAHAKAILELHEKGP